MKTEMRIIGWSPSSSSDHKVVILRRQALGIAEEVGAPGREHETDPHQRFPGCAEEQRGDEEAGHELPALPMDRHQGAAYRIDQTHLPTSPDNFTPWT
jgi:hypothetical protein